MKNNDPVLIQVAELLSTDHVLLTIPRVGDGPVLNLAIQRSLAHLRPWMPWAQEMPSVEESEAVVRRMLAEFLTRQHLAYFLYERAADGAPGRLSGGAGLMRVDWAARRFEIGYWLAPDATGRGLASEAVTALARMAFTQFRAMRVEIRVDALNLASRAVAERCGFTLEGTLRNDMLGVGADPRDTCVYGMVSLDELRSPALALALGHCGQPR
ncbi:Protein N-acetyltransferase, RimJ/RimL family [Roseateles sp. YR242]|uniref:GNAT family N-acetyltransferase n=1 Tax=Roseateles sp. YR242 TaxID=1855305 RepID=UPI0008D63E62|nr:GNAT family protein [Roseateles sp. YR242]SEK55227.1 Protein N-acetyltransferase, RimJ/RimL family [Roseateles sp. YR242]